MWELAEATCPACARLIKRKKKRRKKKIFCVFLASLSSCLVSTSLSGASPTRALNDPAHAHILGEGRQQRAQARQKGEGEPIFTIHLAPETIRKHCQQSGPPENDNPTMFTPSQPPPPFACHKQTRQSTTEKNENQPARGKQQRA